MERKAIWAICLIGISLQFPIEPAASDVPAVHSYNLEYMLSNAQDYRDFDFFVSGINGNSNVSLLPDNKPFKPDYGLREFRLNAIRKNDFDERAFAEDKAAYIKGNAIPSNSTFPSTSDYIASFSVLPDSILIFLKVDNLSESDFDVSREKASYHYPDGYEEDVVLRGAELAEPPHHYSRPVTTSGFESCLTTLILIISAFFLRR